MFICFVINESFQGKHTVVQWIVTTDFIKLLFAFILFKILYFEPLPLRYMLILRSINFNNLYRLLPLGEKLICSIRVISSFCTLIPLNYFNFLVEMTEFSDKIFPIMQT